MSRKTTTLTETTWNTLVFNFRWKTACVEKNEGEELSIKPSIMLKAVDMYPLAEIDKSE